MQGPDQTPEEARASSVPSRVATVLARVGGALSTLLILVILLLVTCAVVQRYVLGQPLSWADDVSGYLLVALLLGSAEALRRGDHIAIDLVISRCGPRGRRAIALLADLAVLAFAVVLAWSTWGQISFAYDFGSYTANHLEIPSWIPMVPLLIACGLLALMALARLLDAVAQGAER